MAYRTESALNDDSFDALLDMPFCAESASEVWRAAEFVSEHQLKNSVLWELFAEQFVKQPDGENGGWRGEYWGKTMRGGCMVFCVTGDEELYHSLEKAVKLLLSAAESDGRISSYARECEFSGWDMWCRKYVLLGLEYFYGICRGETLKARIIKTCRAHLDYIMSRVGEGEGKISITATSRWWGAINSCSILEPVIRLYLLTDERKYLDYAEYIISTGGSNLGNIFELALKNEIPPYKYPVVKAYETMSFFEGIAEYYRITREEKYLKAVIDFTNAVLDTDYTVIGGCGCTHELFDNSSVCQTEDRVEIMQETCVAVTFSKLLYNVFRLTGDIRYADAIETTYYNNILGSINFAKCSELQMDPAFPGDYSHSADFVKLIGGFTFDSYAPLYKSSRNRKTGGYQPIEGGKAYGCCACIGSAGTAVLPLSALSFDPARRALVLSQYINGKFEYLLPTGKKAALEISTGYPYSAELSLSLELPRGCGADSLLLRVPSYGGALITASGKTYHAQAGSFYELPAANRNGNVTLEVEITFDLSAKVMLLNGKAAVKKGCITMAADCRSADINTVVCGKIISDEKAECGYPARLCRKMTFANGASLVLTDYASAGADWTKPERRITVWLDTDAGTKGLETVFASKRIDFVKVSELLADDYLVMINDKEHVGRFISAAHSNRVYTHENEIAWARSSLKESKPVFSMIEKQSGRFIGNIELMDLKGAEAELGIALTAAMQDKGYGTEAIRALISYGAEKLGLKKLRLRTRPWNARAQHVYKKCGFSETGRAEDFIYMELVIE